MQCIASTRWPHHPSPERLAPPRPYGPSPTEQPQAGASSHRWEPEPQIPHPELSTHLSESLGTVGIPSRVQDLLLFWKQRRWRHGSQWRLRVPAPHPAAWDLTRGFSWRCRGLPAAAKIFWLFCALLQGELPGTGAFAAITVANHQSWSQPYLACPVGTGWISSPQRSGSTDLHRSISTDGLCLSPFSLKEEKK